MPSFISSKRKVFVAPPFWKEARGLFCSMAAGEEEEGEGGRRKGRERREGRVRGFSSPAVIRRVEREVGGELRITCRQREYSWKKLNKYIAVYRSTIRLHI